MNEGQGQVVCLKERGVCVGGGGQGVCRERQGQVVCLGRGKSCLGI